MSGDYDPLAIKTTNTELTGLSNTRSSSTQTPLKLDLPELDESFSEEPETNLELSTKPSSLSREEETATADKSKAKPATPPKTPNVEAKMKLLMGCALSACREGFQTHWTILMLCL